ncbi:MAG: rhodanese-like domain-containing protein [Gammaproteobacteria bacterium]|nr:rhodanese-like domain-containing protein [Gammaproteobacteria bacterium]
MNQKRRQFLALLAALPTLPISKVVLAQSPGTWSVHQAHAALLEDRVRLIDIRTRGEWRDTGVAKGAWPVSMHNTRFPGRLSIARELAGDRPLALICATGTRSGLVTRALRLAGHERFINVPEGMLGSGSGPGWVKAGLPVVSIDEALAALPDTLA